MTTLADILRDIGDLDGDWTIFAEEPWHADSSAECVDGTALVEPATVGEKVYFLEVDLARDVLAVWRDWRQGREPSLPEFVQAVIHYAEQDAFIPREVAP